MFKHLTTFWAEVKEILTHDFHYPVPGNETSNTHTPIRIETTRSNSIAPSEDMPDSQLQVAVKMQEFKIYEESKGTPREKYEQEALKVPFDAISQYQNIHQIKLIHAILDYIGTGKKVLDCAGGSGYVATLIRDAGNDVVVMDPSLINLNRAKWIRKLKTVFGKLDKLPFPDNSFDMVLVGEALDSADQFAKSILEVERVCKKEGRILLSVPANSKKDSVQYTVISNKDYDNDILIFSFKK